MTFFNMDFFHFFREQTQKMPWIVKNWLPWKVLILVDTPQGVHLRLPRNPKNARKMWKNTQKKPENANIEKSWKVIRDTPPRQLCTKFGKNRTIFVACRLDPIKHDAFVSPKRAFFLKKRDKKCEFSKNKKVQSGDLS